MSSAAHGIVYNGVFTSFRAPKALLAGVSVLIFGLGMAGGAGSARADMMDLDGAWSGGGSVKFPSGAREAARCRANFKKRGAESYLVSARCASASGKVEQSALLTHVGNNQFSGSFFNQEYKVDGTITVTVSGNSQTVSISSPAGSSANFKLTR